MRLGAMIAALALLQALPASATEWQVLGPRALGMGGAGVAVPNGPLSSYWNPASLARSENPSGFQVLGGAQGEVNGVMVEAANDLNKIYQDCQSGSGNCTQANISSALSEFGNRSNGLRVDINGGANLKFGHLAVFADNLSYFGARPGSVDTTDANPNPASPQYIGNNTTALNGEAFLGTEVGLGYGLNVPLLPGLAVGGNIKAIDGMVSFDSVNVVQYGTGHVLHSPNTVTTIKPGVDVAADWDLDKTFKVLPFHPIVGITGHNINDPKFATPSLEKTETGVSELSYQGNTRAGALLRITNWWDVAGDLDLTRNVTLDGTNSQMIALGTEINIFNKKDFNLPLRAGVNENLASGVKTISLGAGLNLLHVNLDAAVMASPATQSIQSVNGSQKIPESLGAEVQLGVLFGGSEKDVK